MEQIPRSDVLSTDVVNPEKRSNGFSSWVVYTVMVKRNDPSETSSVQRRFKDFVWLRESLRKSKKGVIIPQLPKKSVTMQLSMKHWGLKSTFCQFSMDFIRKRQRGLQRFLNQVVEHNCLNNDPATQLFLSAPNVDLSVARIKGNLKMKDEAVFDYFFRRAVGLPGPDALGVRDRLCVSRENKDHDEEMKSMVSGNKKFSTLLRKFLDITNNFERKQVKISESWFRMGIAAQAFSNELGNESGNAAAELSTMLRNLSRSAERVSNVLAKKAREDNQKLSEPIDELRRTGSTIKALLEEGTTAMCDTEAAKADLDALKLRFLESDSQNSVKEVQLQQEKVDIELKEIMSRVVTEYDVFTKKKMDTLKCILRDFVNREVEYQERIVAGFKKLQNELRSF